VGSTETDGLDERVSSLMSPLHLHHFNQPPSQLCEAGEKLAKFHYHIRSVHGAALYIPSPISVLHSIFACILKLNVFRLECMSRRPAQEVSAASQICAAVTMPEGTTDVFSWELERGHPENVNKVDILVTRVFRQKENIAETASYTSFGKRFSSRKIQE
jgi:hypothetical protein